jgi:hypothetical protein
VWEENLLLYEAFWDLNAERGNGFGEGVIPYVAIRAYAHEEGFEVLALLRTIRKLDKAYLEYREAERERKEKQHGQRHQRNANRARIPRKR